jgi:3-phenylpropionate/trans-cinnamate dioxygenase ferredoxin subunit
MSPRGDADAGDDTEARSDAAAPIPSGLTAPGAAGSPFRPTVPATALPEGAMRRVTFGDLDLLLAHTASGVVAVADRCPHMSAPLSLGQLEGCIVACPLHNGRFDLDTGDVERMPTTGGLLPDGTYVPPWTPEGREPKLDPPGTKAEARRLTRIRRFRYYPVRIVDGMIEVAIPPA